MHGRNRRHRVRCAVAVNATMHVSDRWIIVMKHALPAAVLAILPIFGHAASEPPGQRPIKVAFAISQHVNVMDVAGPWEVFADTSIKDVQGKDGSPYEFSVHPAH